MAIEATAQTTVAVVGAAGHMADTHYIPALLQDHRVRIGALVDYNEAGIDRLVRRHPALMLERPPVFRDISDMLAAIGRGALPPVDAAFLLTHGAGRDELVEGLLESGVKAQMLEKPMAVDISAAERIRRAVTRTGGRVVVNLQYLDWTRRFRPWFAAELTGRFTYGRARWIRIYERRGPQYDILVYDLGGHVLGPLLDIDEWPEVIAAEPMHLRPEERRVHVHANLITQRGAVIEVRLSDELATRTDGTSVFARRGHEFEMDFRLPTRELVTSKFRAAVSRKEHGMPFLGRIPIDPPTTGEMVRHNIEGFVGLVRGETEVEETGLVTVEHGMVLTRALALLSAAHERNQSVTLDDLE